MTKDDFKELVEVRQNFDFELLDRRWFIATEKNASGQKQILFGEQYCAPEVYENFTHLMADAKAGNKFLREALWDIKM